MHKWASHAGESIVRWSVSSIRWISSARRDECVVDICASTFPSQWDSADNTRGCRAVASCEPAPWFGISRCLAGNANVASKQFLTEQGQTMGLEQVASKTAARIDYDTYRLRTFVEALGEAELEQRPGTTKLRAA